MRRTLYLYLLCVGLVLTTGCTKSDRSEETRAAYRRDCIKLRNHSNLNKAVGRVPAAFVFLIRWCFWVKFFGCRGRCVRDLVCDTILCTFFAI